MTKENRTLKFQVYRFDPEQDKKPEMQSYTIRMDDFEGEMLLHAVEHLKESVDPTLGFRRSCREGVCGSDGMNINGRNGLACVTKLADLPDHITLQPLPGLPVIKDLIVDMEGFFSHYKSVQPYLQNDMPEPQSERLQTPEERAKLDGMYECILCACCTSSCPSFWWNPDKFYGPAALLASYRFIADSRDTSKDERLEQFKDPWKVNRCRTIMNCTSACPKGLNPTHAIGKIKQEIFTQSFKKES